jgi:hypothetical protein
MWVSSPNMWVQSPNNKIPNHNSIRKGFSQCIVSAKKDSHMPDTKANVGIPPDATKTSTI